MRSAVVLPQPDGPTRIRNSPSFTPSVNSLTATVSSPNRLVTSVECDCCHYVTSTGKINSTLAHQNHRPRSKRRDQTVS